MSDSVTTAGPGRFEVGTTADSHFGWIRTRLSVERTMMSWLCTATALIGFGFALVEFFERLQQSSQARSAYLPDAPIYLGLALIGCGVQALVLSNTDERYVICGVDPSPEWPMSRRTRPFLRWEC
jgi:putative membrane protein